MTLVKRSHDWFVCYARVFLETESTLVSAAAASGVLGSDVGLTWVPSLCHVASNLLRMIRAQMAHEETFFLLHEAFRCKLRTSPETPFHI